MSSYHRSCSLYVCLYVCVCMYVCMYVCMCVCLYLWCVCVCVICAVQDTHSWVPTWDHAVCMSVCMYLCLYVCLYVCLSICVYVCLSMSLVCVYVYMCSAGHLFMSSYLRSCSLYVCLYVCVSVCVSVYMCVYMCVSLYVYISGVCVYVYMCSARHSFMNSYLRSCRYFLDTTYVSEYFLLRSLYNNSLALMTSNYLLTPDLLTWPSSSLVGWTRQCSFFQEILFQLSFNVVNSILHARSWTTN